MDSALSKSIEVTFIRHAETVGNVQENISCEAVEALKNFTLPSIEQVKAVTTLLNDYNSPVSDLGKRQILDMKMILDQRKFWDRYEFDLCVFSPLQRTKETCMGVVPASRRDKCIPLELIREIQFSETVLPFLALQRVAEFEKWLQNAPVSKLLVVGHSRHLGRLLGLKSLMRNCDVWRANYSFNSETGDNGSASTFIRGAWTDPTLLYRTELSVPHQCDSLFSWPAPSNKNATAPSSSSSSSSSSSNSAVGPNDHDLDNNRPEEPTCRFCQATQSEEPTKKLIRPCLCTGSASYVHVDCLNTWRATSTSAYFTCQVCKYDYQTQRTLLAELTTKEEFVVFVAVLMILTATVLCGVLTSVLCEYFKLSPTIAQRIYSMTELDEYWSYCRARSLPSVSSLLYSVYQGSGGVNDAIKSYIRLMRGPLPMLYFLCHPWVGVSVDVLVTGSSVVSTVGFVMHFHRQIQQLRMFGQMHWIQYVVMTGMWFTSLGNAALGKVWLVIGSAIATREIYLVLVVYARQLSQWLGDRILESAAV